MFVKYTYDTPTPLLFLASCRTTFFLSHADVTRMWPHRHVHATPHAHIETQAGMALRPRYK